MTDREKEIKDIRQLASNIRKYGKEIEKNSEYEYMIDNIQLLGGVNSVSMCREMPIIMLDTAVVKADWFDGLFPNGEAILNRGSVYKIINIIKEHKEFKLLKGIE